MHDGIAFPTPLNLGMATHPLSQMKYEQESMAHFCEEAFRSRSLGHLSLCSLSPAEVIKEVPELGALSQLGEL